MNPYNRYLLPRLLDLAMQAPPVRAERERLLPLAAGRVLEIGSGSGLNLPFYGPGVAALYGLEPSRALQRMARRRAEQVRFPVVLIEGTAEQVPLADACLDTVVTTWTLCTIPNASAALAEMRRVLKPGGRLLFVEHGRSPDRGVRTWQERLTPLWRRLAGGCHLNRPIDELIRAAGFEIDRLENAYVEGPRPMGYLYRGLAHRAA